MPKYESCLSSMWKIIIRERENMSPSNNTDRFELVSFELCPYVQRSVITLLQKKINFKLTFIDLDTPPEWFKKISPMGKVPLLIVRERKTTEPVVLFESYVINEYIDEVTPPMWLPHDPLAKARERGWIAVSGELLMHGYSMMASSDLAEISQAKQDVFEILGKVEEALSVGPYFTGPHFSLVDASFAPFFMRMNLFKSMRNDSAWNQLPKTKRWVDTLLKLPSVRDSVIPDFKKKFADSLREHGSAWATEVE